MRIVFAGTPDVAVPSLDRLVLAGFTVVGVLTRPDARVGRKRAITPSAVAARAEELGIPVLKAARITPEVVARLQEWTPEAAAIVAYGGIVPPAALAIPRHGWINLHFSLLPAWRGAAPLQYSVIHGDDVVGASTFRLEEGLDTGPVFGTVALTPGPEATSGQLLAQLADAGAELLAQTLTGVAEGRLEPRPQAGEPTFAPKLTLEDGRLDWSLPAVALHRRARGVTPEPGAWTMLGADRFKLEPPRLRPDIEGIEPGHLAWADKSLVVGTGTHALELTRVQPAGKKMMAAVDWARGAGNIEGTVLG